MNEFKKWVCLLLLPTLACNITFSPFFSTKIIRVQADVYSVMPRPIPHNCGNWKTSSPACCAQKNYTFRKCWVKQFQTGFFTTGLLRAFTTQMYIANLQILGSFYSILQMYWKICALPPPGNKAFCMEFLSSLPENVFIYNNYTQGLQKQIHKKLK